MIWQRIHVALKWNLAYLSEAFGNWKKKQHIDCAHHELASIKTVSFSTPYNYLGPQLGRLLADHHPKQLSFRYNVLHLRKFQYLRSSQISLMCFYKFHWLADNHAFQKHYKKPQARKQRMSRVQNNCVLSPTCSELLVFAWRTGLTLVWITWSV